MGDRERASGKIEGRRSVRKDKIFLQDGTERVCVCFLHELF